MITDGNLQMKGYLRTIFRAIGFEKEWSGLMTWQWGTSIFSGGGFTHLLNQLCWLFGLRGLEWIFSPSYMFLKLFNQCAFWTGLGGGGRGMSHTCSEYLLSTYHLLSSVSGRIGKKHKESMRHDPCRKGAHDAVLALEQSRTVSVVYIAEIPARPFPPLISALV